ncbi:MAG: ACT domain-containing protein [Candidatus Buchananbacteria bacterium]|nr:ACT domain-containing protein [Candidatus Buchananbacteria bacterium]
MNSEIKKIIKESTFKVEEGKFVYAKVSKVPNIENHFLVSRDADEITVVTKEENLSELDIKERNKDFYRLIAINVSIPFYSVGFLATVSQAIAEKSMNILIVSTYSKDYIMVKDDRLEDAKSVLLKLGFKELR